MRTLLAFVVLTTVVCAAPVDENMGIIKRILELVEAESRQSAKRYFYSPPSNGVVAGDVIVDLVSTMEARTVCPACRQFVRFACTGVCADSRNHYFPEAGYTWAQLDVVAAQGDGAVIRGLQSGKEYLFYDEVRKPPFDANSPHGLDYQEYDSKYLLQVN